MEKNKRSLLEKYGVPLNHLDFGYIKKCTNSKELEKIVEILRSGQEGYYPDLTKCAEDRLRELMPSSKMFRTEGNVLPREHLNADDWKPIYDWTTDIKSVDKELATLAEVATGEVDKEDLKLPPVRKQGKIAADKNDANKKKKGETSQAPDKNDTRRVPSATDYRKWDKYDAEEEILKIDLDDERRNEDVERRNREHLLKSTQSSTVEITEITENEKESLACKLTSVEREKLTEDYRIRGNDYFKAGEFTSALEEYTRCIQMNPNKTAAATAYNNRAITNMKLKRYTNAVNDCDSCLRLDENNVKALLRKGESLVALGRKRDAYDAYFRAQAVEPLNAVAAAAINAIRSELGEIAPSSATRLQIKESSNDEVSEKKKSSTVIPPKTDYDLAELIVPNRIVKNKLTNAVQSLGKIGKPPPGTPPAGLLKGDCIPKASEFRMSTTPKPVPSGRTLIEEL